MFFFLLLFLFLFFQMSSAGGHETIQKAFEWGAMDCLKSPITLEQLRSKIRWFLETVYLKVFDLDPIYIP